MTNTSPSYLPVLHLASQSPRRRQLLESVGLPFIVTLPTTDEEHPDAPSIELVTVKNSHAKASSIIARISNPQDIALGADTLVLLDDQVMGKPRDAQDAAAILKKLSGRTQTVVTGLTLLSSHYGRRDAVVKSAVTFRALSDREINDYTRTREPYDKAGAYAVQGIGALFIERIEGSYTNVMGLPIETVMKELSALTSIPIYEWFLM